MPVTRDMLLNELKELQRLTAFEQAVATVRRTQAASTPVAQELAANATKAGERLGLLAQAVRGAGGTPDVVGPVLGRLGALLQTQVNQVQTLQGALLGDLALEHQLRDRARYARTLAVTLGEMSVLPVLDRLDGAHSETITWLERRLGEVARTGSSALKATPIQVAVGSARRVALAPFTIAFEGINQAGALVARLTRSAPAAVAQVQEAATATAGDVVSGVADAAGSVAERAGQVAGQAADTVDQAADSVEQAAAGVASSAEAATEQAAGLVAGAADTVSDAVSDAVSTAADATTDAVGTGADAASGTATIAADAVSITGDTVADVAGATPDPAAAAEQTTHEVLVASGGDDVADSKPPFAGYERLSGDSIMRHVDDTEDVEELRTLLAFEQAHKARKGVLKTVQDRLTALSAS